MIDTIHQKLRLLSTRDHVLLTLLLLAVIAMPLALTALPPLTDLPGHVGRYRVQLDLAQSPDLQRYFSFRWSLVPNLGVDLLIQLIAPIVGLEAGVKWIVTAIPVLTALGIISVAKALHGHVPPTALFALPLAYNYPLRFGFVNYCLAMALALLAFALWLGLRRRFGWVPRALAFAPIGAAICVAHLSGWAALLVMTGAAEFVRQFERRGASANVILNVSTAVLPIALGGLAVLLASAVGQAETGSWFEIKRQILWLVGIVRDRFMIFDIGSAAIIGLVAISPLLLRHRFKADARAALPGVALLLLAFLLPNNLKGSAFAGVRLFPYALCLLIVSIRPRSSISPSSRSLIGLSALAFLTARLVVTTVSFQTSDRLNQRLAAALDHVEPGSRVLSLIGNRCGFWWTPPYTHLSELATARRDAFSNGHWLIPGGQLIGVHYQAAEFFRADPSQLLDGGGCAQVYPSLATRIEQAPLDAFDYLWIIELPEEERPQHASLVPIWSARNSVLYRIDRRALPRPERPTPLR